MNIFETMAQSQQSNQPLPEIPQPIQDVRTNIGSIGGVPVQMSPDMNQSQLNSAIQPPTKNAFDLMAADDKRQQQLQESTPAGQTPAETEFLKTHPDHAYIPYDPKFPKRPAGVYPTGSGNEWRKNPDAEQQPVDPDFIRNTIEHGVGSAAATGLATGLPAAIPEVLPAVERFLQISEQALEHLAENYPQLTKLAGKLGYGAGAAGAYKLLNKLGIH